MDKKDIVTIVLKCVVYACTLLLAALGAVAVTSCTIQRQSEISGRAVIVTTYTTVINHSGIIHFPKQN